MCAACVVLLSRKAVVVSYRGSKIIILYTADALSCRVAMIL